MTEAQQVVSDELASTHRWVPTLIHIIDAFPDKPDYSWCKTTVKFAGQMQVYVNDGKFHTVGY